MKERYLASERERNRKMRIWISKTVVKSVSSCFFSSKVYLITYFSKIVRQIEFIVVEILFVW